MRVIVDWSTFNDVELVFSLLRNTLLTRLQLVAVLSAEANLNTRATDTSTPPGSGLQTNINKVVSFSLRTKPLSSACTVCLPYTRTGLVCTDVWNEYHSCAQAKEDDDIRQQTAKGLVHAVTTIRGNLLQGEEEILPLVSMQLHQQNVAVETTQELKPFNRYQTSHS